ncbi:polysaccharide pyruvyl transferase family protein [Microbacterium phyllosphaerae]|uniref:polysaccharide pyruvyl transferase family protein n=1 Tax=Microbacterium phyllosphaerae TaxID=124798 RepID=UPI0021680458|nr:polysaccharide pyruvyl transferase family protein [Microbacterium phyllosphaerae]MCS3443278.1 polysaccharide pyruvyl transferase WcaK-like protein [Microbacterium phyllosphaerae]
MMSQFKILLLTNRDSDNVGDQIIEESVLSVLRGVMKNLGLSAGDVSINSRAAGIITKKYLQTGDEALLADARRSISAADVVVFGGAPLFNYAYQVFYRRTIKTLELAEEYGVPVLFSSIGVEPFDATNPKCLELKKALNLSCVKQITTRDDLVSVRKYVEGTDIPVAHVADPAVLADIVFRKAPTPKPATTTAPAQRSIRRGLRRRAKRLLAFLRPTRPTPPAPSSATASPAPAPASPPAVGSEPKATRIGLVVTREGLARDNRIDFTLEDQRRFWLDVIDLLTERGYDYRLFTTGHFSDEVFLDYLIREDSIPLTKCVPTINSPEELISQLNGCTGVIAFRLHASITSYALGVPSVGLSWNFKVPRFYESVGLEERALAPERWTAVDAVDAIEKAIDEGVVKDEVFMSTVYDTLFTGLKGIIAPDGEHEPYSYRELRNRLPRFTGTTMAQYREKVRRKMRRAYDSYHRHNLNFVEHRDASESRA